MPGEGSESIKTVLTTGSGILRKGQTRRAAVAWGVLRGQSRWLAGLRGSSRREESALY